MKYRSVTKAIWAIERLADRIHAVLQCIRVSSQLRDWDMRGHEFD